jgi:AraC-like DNA-binding protein/quercetin dioxygenase-like cupin family protein
MSRTRHFPEVLFADEDGLTEEFLNSLLHTAAYTIPYDKGHGIPDHSHRRGHLIRPLMGSLRVNVSSDVWLVSSGQALWLSPQTPHAMDVLTSSLVQFVYVNPAQGETQMPATGRIDVPLLLGGILDELSARVPVRDEVGSRDRLTSVMLDQVMHAHNQKWLAECPGDRRLAIIYQMLIRDPSNRRTLRQLAEEAGVSARTVGRLLRTHCNVSFREWREMIILGLALNRLKHGGRVTDVALDLGYTSASAFISAFKKLMDITPKQWFQQARRAPGNEGLQTAGRVGQR